MSTTFNFNTENEHIDGKIVYDIKDRDEDGYEVSYTVSLRRNNIYTGTPTSGQMSYKVYSNGKAKKSGSHAEFIVKNNGSWCKVVEGSYTVSLGAFKSAKHSIGFSSSSSSGILGLTAKQQTKEYSVSAYMTQVGAPTVTIIDNGNNSFKIQTTTGSKGTNNKAIGCTVYYTTDGKEPNSDNGTRLSVDNDSGDKHTFGNKTITKDLTVKAKGYTLSKAKDDDVSGAVNTSAATESLKVKYYASPSWGTTGKVTISYNTTKPTPRSTYTVAWSGAANGNSNSPINGYKYYVHFDDELKLSNTVNASTKSFTFSNSGNTSGMESGTNIKVKVVPYTKNGAGTVLNGSAKETTLKVKSPAIMHIKTSDGWVSGRTYVKTSDGWVEAKGIYAKTANGWGESK